MPTTRKDRRTRVPKAKKELVLTRDRKFERKLKKLSVKIQQEIEREEEQQAKTSWGKHFPSDLVIKAA